MRRRVWPPLFLTNLEEAAEMSDSLSYVVVFLLKFS